MQIKNAPTLLPMRKKVWNKKKIGHFLNLNVYVESAFSTLPSTFLIL